jgi:predicted 3-demethylubiquinone-9 3-methyltransferase (glyoxalase superfamily)
MQKISPFLWFDDKAEEAAAFYVSIFKNSKMGKVARHNEASAKMSRRPVGSAMTVAFQLEGQDFTAINGGPMFKFSEAVSFVVGCDTQEELDRYWDALAAGGDPNAQQCGWLKDKYGLSWQIVPASMDQLTSGDPKKVNAAMNLMLTMKKLDVAALKRAYDGA